MADVLSTQGLIGDPSALPNSVNIVGNTDVTNVSEDIIGDPGAFLERKDMKLSDEVPTIDADTSGTNVDGKDPRFSTDTNALSKDADTVGYTNTAVDQVKKDAETFQAETTFDRVTRDENDVDAATGEVRDAAIIDAEDMTVDMTGAGTGRNEDGTVNQLGVAVNDFASQDISNVIDTSTVAGKILAQTLGEGNYTDSKQTVMGQLELISEQFTGPDGQPKIPTWAAGIARNVNRTFAFTNAGTAGQAAVAQAMIEATLPIAQQDAQIFNGIAMKNLDNKQQATINKAMVLSKLELANLDARMNAALNNSKNFMQMDLANMSNIQQARVINSQARVQSLLEDAKMTNAARMFSAEQSNDMNKFYDQLDTNIQIFNSEQLNGMKRFNTGEVNDRSEFNSSLENAREQFYQNMQYNIDLSNAKWRQSVTLQNNQNQFDAAATDVKNMVGLTSEQLNQMWDRSDAQLDWTWKSSENQADRDLKMFQMKMEMQMAAMKAKADKKKGLFGAVGSVLGSVAGNMFGAGGVMASGGAGWGALGTVAKLGLGLITSDEQLKENITRIGTHKSGLPLYKWDWSETAKSIGAEKFHNVGVLAQEAMKTHPHAVSRHPIHGYLTVKYERLQ
ncbi:hypothetical protein CRP3_gp24 [Roseobacter phage CRP-3]|nr:hypothetical protein CRP3_gp24 [Roseobacter phage CRP-3]